MSKLVHPELSYRVRGVLLDVHRTVGPLLKEEVYRDAIVLGLEKRGIPCVPEKAFEVYYRENRVGLYYVDVWVDGGKLLLELKVAPEIAPEVSLHHWTPKMHSSSPSRHASLSGPSHGSPNHVSWEPSGVRGLQSLSTASQRSNWSPARSVHSMNPAMHS